ncbi:hypothetical protein Tco_0717366 [Tanacetum coccineum]
MLDGIMRMEEDLGFAVCVVEWDLTKISIGSPSRHVTQLNAKAALITCTKLCFIEEDRYIFIYTKGFKSIFGAVAGECGVNLINGICLNCTYGDGKPVTCCGCEGPLNGGFCSFCASRAGNSFAYDPNPNSFDDSQNLSDYPPQPQYQTYSCELCGNDAHYGYDCPPQVPFEIISGEFNSIHNEDLDSTPKNDRFDIESYLLESLLNCDTLMASSPKIDSLLDEFVGELITIPSRIVNREHEEYISLLERLIYDNSSPRLPKDFHANPNTIIESLPTFPIPVEDSDSLGKIIYFPVRMTQYTEKSPPSSSHRGFKASKLFHHKSLMLIYGEDIPILDILIAPVYEASRARGFVIHSLELQSFA